MTEEVEHQPSEHKALKFKLHYHQKERCNYNYDFNYLFVSPLESLVGRT
jgi:hypothetical protein